MPIFFYLYQELVTYQIKFLRLLNFASLVNLHAILKFPIQMNEMHIKHKIYVYKNMCDELENAALYVLCYEAFYIK